MQLDQITIGPIILASPTIVAFFIGMICMRISLWRWKRIKKEVISIDGPKYRFPKDDESKIREEMKKLYPRYKIILNIECISTLTSGISEDYDRRVYEIKYI